MAFVEGDTFIRSARSANAAARRLAEGLLGVTGVGLSTEVEANIVFAVLPSQVIDRLTAEGFLFFRRAPDTIRLVCSFDLTDASVDRFVQAVRAHMGAPGP